MYKIKCAWCRETLCTEEEKKREILKNCLRSFYRNRHGNHNIYKKTKKRPIPMTSNHGRYCQIIRGYIAKLRNIKTTGR
jgi:hypothetical protein